MSIGDQIRRAREEAGLTQEQLAFEAKLHRTYISLLERDKKAPTLTALFRICRACGIRPSTLVARIEKSSGKW